MNISQMDEDRYSDYMRFLLENGANQEILELQAIQVLIADLIRNGDPRVKSEGRSPVAYFRPKEDGTFEIGGRTSGYTANVRYDMKYCDDDSEGFIKLVNKHYRRSIPSLADQMAGADEDGYIVADTTTIIIDRDGKIKDKRKRVDYVTDEKELSEAYEREGMRLV